MTFVLNGKKVDPPKEWRGLQILSSFTGDNVQASISTEEFSFVGDARKEILKHIEEGYYFEGMPFDVQIQKGSLNYESFRGFLDLQDTFVDYSSDIVTSKIKKLNGLNQFGEKLTGLTYGYLYSEGFINDRTVEYVVEKRKNLLEIVMSGIMIYLLTKELLEATKRLKTTLADGIGETAGGLSGAVGAAIMFALKIVIDLIYTAAIVSALIEMVTDLLNSFISPVRKYKCSSYLDMLKGACEYLGYNFESSIDILGDLYYLPSKPFDGNIKSGVPRKGDAGYNVGDFFAIMKSMFSADIGIIGKTVYLENKDSDFWVKQSTYSMPSNYKEKVRKNGDELAGTRVLSFVQDPNDEWSIQNRKGNNYEIRTLQSSYKNGIEYLTIDSVDDRIFPFVLPNRKNKLNDLEKTLKTLAELLDTAVKSLGGKSNLANKIKNRVGMLKLGTESHTLPRILYLKGGKLPSNYRDFLSAKYFYENYIKADSFVLSKNGGQKIIYEGVRIKFGFSDFLQLIENSYFTTDNGQNGKVLKISWAIDSDFAEIDYWIKDPNPTDKLIETYIEPS